MDNHENQMRRAVVFGGGGFIGSAVVEALIRHNVEVCAVVKPGFSESAESIRLKNIDIPMVQCDLRNISELRHKLPWKTADIFYQTAWDGLSNDRITDYKLQLENVKWMLESVEEAARLGCRVFVGAGTISQDELFSHERYSLQGNRHRYFRCASQLCEYMGESLAYDNGISFIWPVISNVYGEGDLSSRLINTLIRKLLAKEAMELSSGLQPYDFIYKYDAGEALYRIGRFGKTRRRYNVSSGESKTLKEYLLRARDIVAPDVELSFNSESKGVVLNSDSFNISVLKEDTGFSCSFSFEEGIKRTSEWISVNLSLFN